MRILLLAILTTIIIGFPVKLDAQKLHIECDTTHFHFEDYVDSMNYYEIQMGTKKTLNISDDGLKLAFYVALNRYPELHHTKIT
ncbi:MAG: hypothetical protein ISP70_02400 [Crocinitomicaceae bacterium]|nr:hypothetical protein [Crocinitomicaceae bacterium]